MTNVTNIAMPRFGRASGIDNWSDEVDNFDIDLLAECLLEDGTGFPTSSTFDFNLDASGKQASSTVVSPENSVDGNLPSAANTSQSQSTSFQPATVSTMFAAPVPAGNAVQGIPQLAPAPTMAQSQLIIQQQQQQQQFQNLAGLQTIPGVAIQQLPTSSLIYQDSSVAAPDMKRPRVDNPIVTAVPQLTQMIPAMAQAGVTPGMMMMNVQQLAVAAMQQQQQGRARKKSQAQIDRRRERNRILARRTRLRKKFFFEALQKEVMDLQRENMRLKSIVKDEIANDEGRKILEECDAVEKMPPGILEAMHEEGNCLDVQDYNFVRSVQNSQHCFIITDPSLADNPIVFASDDFLQLTGYSREQVLGRNCRFLQGTDTSQESVQQIRKSLAEGEDVSVTLVNYMADGTPFWNRLFIAALRDAQNNFVNFIGVIVKVPGPGLDGDEDDDDDDNDQQDETNQAVDAAPQK